MAAASNAASAMSPPASPALSNSSATAAEPTKKRARDLLREHYKITGKGAGSALMAKTDSATSDSGDPMDLDSPLFNPSMYYSSLLNTASLPALLKQSNDLQTEINLLDAEKHALVYNHHHELVAASDTISKLTSPLSPISDSLDSLRMSFSNISQLNASLASFPLTAEAKGERK